MVIHAVSIIINASINNIGARDKHLRTTIAMLQTITRRSTSSLISSPFSFQPRHHTCHHPYHHKRGLIPSLHPSHIHHSMRHSSFAAFVTFCCFASSPSSPKYSNTVKAASASAPLAFLQSHRQSAQDSAFLVRMSTESSSTTTTATTMANNTTDDQDQRPTLKGVVFDMDGTLTVANLDFDDMYARCEIPKDHDILTYLNDNPANLTPQQIQAKFDIIQDMEREATQTLQLQPGVPEVLQWLSHNNIPMALITRNTMISVDGMYDKFPDLPRFEIVVTRDDAYAPKPDPAGMHAIRKQWNFDATSIVMIGDSYTNDVQFGKAAGVATIWLDLDATTESDAICNRFYKLARQLYLNFEISGIAELRKYPVPQPTTPATIAAAAGEFIGGDNAPDSTGNTPLIWAADAGHENVVAQLLQQGDSIDINARGYLGATAVCRAARRGHTAALKLLIEAGADLDIPNDKMQYPLHFAAFKEMPDAVNSLLDGGANGCVLDRKGRIPAMDTKNESIREQIMARMP